MALAGKIFVVTGGASGIGKATVKKLLEQSAKVHVLDFAAIPIHEDAPGKQRSYPLVDVASRHQVKAAFETIAKQDPWVTGLVNCAGILRHTACSAKSDDTFRALWDVNVMGTWNAITEFYHHFKLGRLDNTVERDRPTASIVNVGSMASVRGIPGMSGYVASKHAVHGITGTIAQELGPEGIRINTVAPGAVNTPMIAGRTQGGDHHGAFKGAFKTLSEPEEIADVVLYLLGEGSSSVSGQLIEANGGWP